MKRPFAMLIWLVMAALVASGCATATLKDFDNTYTIEGADKMLAFVGRKVAVERVIQPPPVSENEDEIVILMDEAFVARYEILDVVHGDYGGRTIDFEAYDHYGYPMFAKHDLAMLYVVEYEGALFHRKYQWDRVHPTKDGRYAYCGDPYFLLDETELEDVDRRSLEPIEFDPPVVTRISEQIARKSDPEFYSPEEIAQNRDAVTAHYAAPVFKIRGDRAFCKMGVYPDELYRIKNETLFLPEQRREICEAETGYSSADWQNEQKRAAVAACVADKKAKG